MAKTVTTSPTNQWGEITGRPETKRVGRAETGPIPWTRGPQTRWQRIVRAAIH